MFCHIIPFGKSFDEIGFTYKIPEKFLEKIKIGQIVKIPFGKEENFGVIISVFSEKVGNEKFHSLQNNFEIKEILEIVNEKSFIYGYRIELLKFISEYYFTPIHNSLNLFLPKNLIEKVKKEKFEEKFGEYKYLQEKNNKLTENQKNILEEIIGVSEENNGFLPSQEGQSEKKFLLFGVTGSGKTEIYIKLIEKYLIQGKQSLLLIPEIILTNQISEKLKNYFGKDLIVLNSTVSDAKKTKYFSDIESGNAKIIIGTRSALFYPFSDLGIIIIDEEHDNSYISDQNPRYNAIEVANKITDLNGNKLLLASGTPSINSMFKGIKGEYKLLSLLEKFRR